MPCVTHRTPFLRVPQRSLDSAPADSRHPTQIWISPLRGSRDMMVLIPRCLDLTLEDAVRNGWR